MPSTAIDFEELPESTIVSTQYKGLGLTFVTPPQQGPLPSVWVLASGKKVIHIRGSAEIAFSEARGSFDKPRRNVAVVAVNGRDSDAEIRLSALDVAGNVLETSKLTLIAGEGATSTIEISRATDDIYAFVFAAVGTYPRVYVDSIVYNQVEGAIGPDFGLTVTVSNPMGLICAPGASVDAKVQVVRTGGSTGGVVLSAGGLPAGLTAVFIPNPMAKDQFTMKLSVAASASASGLVKLTVVGKPASPSAGSVARSAEVILSIPRQFEIDRVMATLPPCTVVSIPVKVSLPPAGFGGTPSSWSGTVELSVSGLPAGVSGKLVPSSVSLSKSSPAATVSLEVRDESHAVGGQFTATITGKSPPLAPITAEAVLTRTGPVITDFSPKLADAPRGLRPGTEVTITGGGFCAPGPGALVTSVELGNPQAVVKPHWIAPDGRSARVRVPRLATTGPIKVSSVAGTAVSASWLEVRTYRNTYGFSFVNPKISDGVNYGELTEAFGKDQTWITVSFDPCDGIPIVGWFVDCDIQMSLFPNPLGLIVLGLAQLLDACCFGMSLTTVRMMRGDQSLAPFSPAGATKAWGLDAPPSPAPAIHHHVFITALQQLGAEFLHNYAKQAMAFFGPGTALLTTTKQVATGIRDQIKALLAAGEHPLIALRDGGAGHLTVATDLEEPQDGSAFYYIHVYDPNIPFLNTENVDSNQHAQREISLSRIVVDHEGNWTHPGIGWGPHPPQNPLSVLAVVPYSATPLRPTFPVTPSGLVTVVFGSATVTQVEGADGRTLLGPGSELVADPQQRLNASPFALLSGREGGAQGVVIDERQPVALTLAGNEEGRADVTLLGGRLTAQLSGLAMTPGSVDRIRHNQEQQTVSFKTTDAEKPLHMLVVAQGADEALRTIRLRTTAFREGVDELSYDEGRGAVIYRHEGPETRCSFEIGWTGKDGLPCSFSSRDIEVLPGQETVLQPESWRRLGRDPVRLIVRGADGSESETRIEDTTEGPSPSLSLRAVEKDRETQLEIDVLLPRSEEWSSVVVTFSVVHGQKVVARATRVEPGPFTEGICRLSIPFAPKSQGAHELIVYARGVTLGLPTRVRGVEARLKFGRGPVRPIKIGPIR